MHWLDPLLVYAGLVAWGGHAVAPWRLARGAEAERRRWRLAAPPALAAGVLAFALAVALHPDRAVAVGLGRLPLGGRLPLVLTLTAGVLALAEGVVLLAGPRLERAGWRLAALLALPALAAFSWAAELLRIGEGPAGQLGPAAGAAACRALVALAAGEALAPGRPVLAAVGAAGLAVYLLLLPAALAEALAREGFLLTLGASALLLGAARWLPARYRRGALAAGGLLAALFFARAGAVSEALSVLQG